MSSSQAVSTPFPGVFVTGTDTGVGKTRVGAALVFELCRRGRVVRARKPAESGCAPGPEGLWPADAATLQAAAGGLEPLDRVCPYRLRAALSPERAAAMEGIELSLDALVTACRAGCLPGDVLHVEGAGGFLSPVAAQTLNADLAEALGLPVLVVVADRLGAINHTLMTVEAIRRRGLRLAGVVLSEPVPGARAEGMDNAADLARWLDQPILRIDHGTDEGPAAWQREGAALAPLIDRWSAL